MALDRLTRAAWARRGGTEDLPPVRMVHLGLGAFHRAHQAWYTARSEDWDKWGIAAFSGRSPHVHTGLSEQGGLYSLTTRAADGDAISVIPSIVALHAANDTAALAAYLTDPAVAVVTLTITEPGYDIAPTQPTALRRLVDALEARRRADIGPLAVVPCDNIPGNGQVVLDKMLMLADQHYRGLRDWIHECVACVSTSVDRITPAWDGTPVDAVVAAGWDDRAPVVTEPFSDWVLQGEFPAGRPQWDSMGATFVTDIGPFDRRKRWLLNGAHSIMAWSGMLAGLEWVHECVEHPPTVEAVEAYWAEAIPHVGTDVDTETYRELLWERWMNPRTAHSLRQIAADSASKLPVRLADVAMHQLRSGADAPACAQGLGLWVRGVRELPPVDDALAKQVALAARSADPVTALVRLIHADLADVADFVRQVRTTAEG